MNQTISFEYWFHPAAAISLPDDSLATSICHERIRHIAAAFIANVSGVSQAAIAPMEILFWTRTQQTAIDEAHLEVWGDLVSRKHDDPLTPEFEKAMVRLRQKFSDEVEANPTAFGERMFLAAGQLEVFQKNNAQIREGLAAVLRGMVTGMWTAFEVLASDLWETALNIYPAELAQLKGSVPASMRKSRKSFSALATDDVEKPLSSKMIKLNYLQSHGYDLSHRMGTVLREKFNFQILESIRDAYLQGFDKSHVAVREAILHPSLTVLAAVRNVLIHRAGLVDREFLNEITSCEELRAVFPNVEAGMALAMTGLTVHSLIQPVVMQSVKLIEAVNASIVAK